MEARLPYRDPGDGQNVRDGVEQCRAAYDFSHEHDIFPSYQKQTLVDFGYKMFVMNALHGVFQNKICFGE
jgi:hypothetical protein